MSENYEKTKPDGYWLLMAMEEGAEVIQAVSKVIRHGDEKSFELLDNELNDLMYVLRILEHKGYLEIPDIEDTIKYAETKKPHRKFKSILRGD